VLAGMAQSPRQFVPPVRPGAGGTALVGDLPGDVQIDEQVGLGDALPHRGRVGVLLYHLADVVASRPQRPDEH